MTNHFIPKNTCSKCGKITWNYNPNTARCICKHCGKFITKVLHGLIGAELSKNAQGNYVLSFPEYNEESVFANYEDMQKDMERLSKND